MAAINWEQFKMYKQERQHPVVKDNFDLILEFLRHGDALISPEQIFDILVSDELAAQMLEKRGITEASGLNEYLHKLMFR